MLHAYIEFPSSIPNLGILGMVDGVGGGGCGDGMGGMGGTSTDYFC